MIQLQHTKSLNQEKLEKFRLLFTYFMAGIYMCGGIYLLFQGWYSLSRTQTILLGIMLVAYSIFRMFRIYRSSRIKAGSDGQSA